MIYLVIILTFALIYTTGLYLREKNINEIKNREKIYKKIDKILGKKQVLSIKNKNDKFVITANTFEGGMWRSEIIEKDNLTIQGIDICIMD